MKFPILKVLKKLERRIQRLWIMLLFTGLAACQTQAPAEPKLAIAKNSLPQKPKTIKGKSEPNSSRSSAWLANPFAECAKEAQVLSYLYGKWGFDRLAIATDKARYYARIHTEDYPQFPPRELAAAERKALKTLGPKAVEERIALSLQNKGNSPIIECYSEDNIEGSGGNMTFLATFEDMQLPETTKRVYDLSDYYLIAENEIMIDMRMDIISDIVVPGVYAIYRRLSP